MNAERCLHVLLEVSRRFPLALRSRGARVVLQTEGARRTDTTSAAWCGYATASASSSFLRR